MTSYVNWEEFEPVDAEEVARSLSCIWALLPPKLVKASQEVAVFRGRLLRKCGCLALDSPG